MPISQRALEGRPRWQFLVFGVFLLSLLALADIETGPDFTLGPFYLLPLCIVAWWGGSAMGVIMAVLTTTSWLTVQFCDQTLPHLKPMFFLNVGIRVTFNIIVAFVLPAWRDVSRRLERMVAERTAALHVLAADLAAAEDAQRRQLAHDIHDALGQNLSLLRIHLEAIARDLPATAGADELHTRVSTEVGMINSLIEQTRTLTFDLYPPMLDDLGLMAALEGYAEDFSRRTGAEATVSQVGMTPEVSPPTPVTHYLFRAVRELMGNAVKHGKAKQIVITVHWQPDGIRLTVDDDGSGFDQDVSTELRPGEPRRGLGLAGIRQRLTAMGGSIQLDSRQGQGTRVILKLPMNNVVNHSNKLQAQPL